MRVGAVAPGKMAESQRTSVPLLSLHWSKFAPEGLCRCPELILL